MVMKFGGTSVADEAGRAAAADRVAAAREEGYRVVVVVSAMGRTGDPYATDTLIDLARQVYRETNSRELDLLTACGEIISSVVLVNTLLSLGVPAVALTGWQAGIVTDNQFTAARIRRVEPAPVLKHLERGEVVVVAGFQGGTENGEITTLGRGGSDTTAAALSVALQAVCVEIYTDVEGVKTADPRLVPDARTLDNITYEELSQMSVEGARVIHPRAVEIAMRGNVPLRVRSTFHDSPGTLVTHTWDAESTWREGRIITGLAHMTGRALVVAWSKGGRGSGQVIPDLPIFRALADAGISVDMINVSPDRKAFIVIDDDAQASAALLAEQGLVVEVRTGCAKITVIGTGMRGVPGVMANIVEALARAEVNILLSVDSHITISCLVDGVVLESAIRSLHEQFQLGRGGGDSAGE